MLGCTTDIGCRNGRWRSQYLLDPSTGSITGDVKVDVHYYEDGNVRLLTNKPMTASCSASAGGSEVVRQISILERKYQEDLNRAFTNLSEGVFKSLRRQLPVTRQKVEWDKVSGYRVCEDAGLLDGSHAANRNATVGSRHWRWSVSMMED